MNLPLVLFSSSESSICVCVCFFFFFLIYPRHSVACGHLPEQEEKVSIYSIMVKMAVSWLIAGLFYLFSFLKVRFEPLEQIWMSCFLLQKGARSFWSWKIPTYKTDTWFSRTYSRKREAAYWVAGPGLFICIYGVL